MEGFKKGAQTGGLISHGQTMGFARGGQVKHTTPLPVKDTGNMPAKKDGDSQQEKEAGGRAKVRPGYKEGGYVKAQMGGKTVYKKGGKVYMMKGGKMHPYMHGGIVKTHTMPNRSQGEHVQPAQRGAKHIGKGGKTGAHKYLHSDSSGSKSERH